MGDMKKRDLSFYDESLNNNGYGNAFVNDYKRIKVDNSNSTATIQSEIPPSPVVHCRGLPPNTSESELINLLSPFGTIVSICLMSKGQALIEMNSIESSTNIINRSHSKPFTIQNIKIMFSFSRSQHLNNGKNVNSNNTIGESKGTQQYNQNILLCSILNPIYPITTNTLLYIMQNYGRVLRIVIFQKHGLQAFVEFENIYSAWNAKEALNGQDIYTGSCTLQIEFARVNKLNVKQNDDKTADYTTMGYYPTQIGFPVHPHHALYTSSNPYIQGVPTTASTAGTPTSTTSTTSAVSTTGGSSTTTTSSTTAATSAYPPPPPVISPYTSTSVGYPTHTHTHTQSHPHPHHSNTTAHHTAGTDSFLQTNDSVLIVHKLPENLDSDKLFNLFCLYGNVLKIKMLHSTKGSALVQLANNIQSDIAGQCLHLTPIYGQTISVHHTKFSYIADSEKTKDYSQSKFNRFQNSYQQFTKNSYKPSSTLHFLNVPTSFTESDLKELFTATASHSPTAVKFFPNKPGVESKKQMGLVEFSDTKSATEALMDLNNLILDNGSTLKLSFTMNTIHKNDHQQALNPSKSNNNNESGNSSSSDSSTNNSTTTPALDDSNTTYNDNSSNNNDNVNTDSQ